MRVALVHDYLIEYGGAERVVEALHQIWPEASLFVAYVDLNRLGENGQKFKGWDIRSSWLQNVPFAGKLISPFRILAPQMFESFDLSEYDLVISSCNVYFSKAVKVRPRALHLSYIHTPPRYLYGYATSYNYKKRWWTRIGGEIMNHFLRIVDFQVSQRPDILIANSQNVARRIKKFYRRDSVVVYPPVEVEKFRVQSSDLPAGKAGFRVKDKKYFLSVSRLVRGKGVEVIIEACGRLGLSLKVVGSGPELDNLKKLTTNYKLPTTIQFLGQVKDQELVKLYAGAKATVVASEDEDFGIVPVESMAAGTPVIAVKSGGYLETVIPAKTGEFFINGTIGELMKVLEKFNLKKYRVADLQKQAAKFSVERFQKEILKLVEDNLKQP